MFGSTFEQTQSPQGLSDSGRSSATWTVPTNLLDGSYELAVRTVCTPSVSAPVPGVQHE